ncbi:MAG: DUF6036 family nucleotidyltransferase [Nitrospirota bacterium]
MAREYLAAEDAIDALIRSVESISRRPVSVILLGGLAMAWYGSSRQTRDLDAEVSSLTRPQLTRLWKLLGFPADLSADVSHWGMIDLPPGYRNRAKTIRRRGRVTVRILSPLDLVMSKLRVMRDSDIQDARFLIRRFKITKLQIRRAMNRMIRASVPSTDLFFFQRFVEGFLKGRFR